VSPHCFCPCCCLPPLLLLPSAGVVYNAALTGSSAAFSAVDAPLLHLLLTLLAAAAVLARGEIHRFLFLFLPPPPPLKFIGPGVAQARPKAQNSPVYAKQAPFCFRFTGVWNGPVLYLN
jgi:hypothetical protein